MQSPVFNGQVIMADGSNVGLANGSYTVRVWVDAENKSVRGSIRREESDQTIRFQSGDRIGEFIRSCLVDIPSETDSGIDHD